MNIILNEEKNKRKNKIETNKDKKNAIYNTIQYNNIFFG